MAKVLLHFCSSLDFVAVVLMERGGECRIGVQKGFLYEGWNWSLKVRLMGLLGFRPTNEAWGR